MALTERGRGRSGEQEDEKKVIKNVRMARERKAKEERAVVREARFTQGSAGLGLGCDRWTRVRFGQLP